MDREALKTSPDELGDQLGDNRMCLHWTSTDGGGRFPQFGAARMPGPEAPGVAWGQGVVGLDSRSQERDPANRVRQRFNNSEESLRRRAPVRRQQLLSPPGCGLLEIDIHVRRSGDSSCTLTGIRKAVQSCLMGLRPTGAPTVRLSSNKSATLTECTKRFHGTRGHIVRAPAIRKVYRRAKPTVQLL
jgi:hypothetical protein